MNETARPAATRSVSRSLAPSLREQRHASRAARKGQRQEALLLGSVADLADWSAATVTSAAAAAAGDVPRGESAAFLAPRPPGAAAPPSLSVAAVALSFARFRRHRPVDRSTPPAPARSSPLEDLALVDTSWRMRSSALCLFARLLPPAQRSPPHPGLLLVYCNRSARKESLHGVWHSSA